MAWHGLIPQAPQLFATGRMHDFGPSIILDLIRTLVCGLKWYNIKSEPVSGEACGFNHTK